MSSSQRDPHTFAGQPPHEDDHLLGMELGSYRLVERLGEGASAVVYRAEHVRLGIPYAIKILHPIIASRQGMRERFLREAQAAGSLRHENVVFIADFAIDTKIGPYMVMEYLEGETLQAVLEREGALPIERARNIAKQICKALAVAHDTGIIHRDLKPENIFLLNRKGGETVKILDFGIARLAQHTHNLTGAGNIVGTPLYMSPEQCRGDGELTKSTDLYSFGVMLFQMLMGHTPFQGTHPQKLLIDHFLVPAPPLSPSFPEPLRKLQAELLAKTPEERPPDMETVWRRLADALVITAPNNHQESQPYDDGGDDDYTDLTAAFEAVPDPNAPTVSLRETHPSDFSRATGRSLEREETDFLPRPPQYQTPLPPLAPALSIHPPDIEYDRQTLESLPAMTPEVLAAHTNTPPPKPHTPPPKPHTPPPKPHTPPPRPQPLPIPEQAEPVEDHLDTDGFRQVKASDPTPLSSPALPTPTPTPASHTDEELLKDLALYASHPTPASSSAWPEAHAAPAEWNGRNTPTASPWQDNAWSPTHSAQQNSEAALDQLLAYPPLHHSDSEPNALTDIHLAATSDDPNDSPTSLDFDQFTQTELQAATFRNFNDPDDEPPPTKPLFLILLFLAIVSFVGISLYVGVSLLSSTNETPKDRGLGIYKPLIHKYADLPCASEKTHHVCHRFFSTHPQGYFSQSSKSSIPASLPKLSTDSFAYCLCAPLSSKTSVKGVLTLPSQIPIKLSYDFNSPTPRLVVFDFKNQKVKDYPLSLLPPPTPPPPRLPSLPTPPVPPPPSKSPTPSHP